MIAERNIKKGEPLYINYNTMNNTCFFIKYGFVELNHKSNDVTIYVQL